MAKKFGHKRAEKIDEHDAPTEPLPKLDITLPYPPITGATSAPWQQASPVSPGGHYPYLPVVSGGQDEGEKLKGRTTRTLRPAKARTQQRKRWSPIPTCVGIFFVLIQMLLLVRFVSSLLHTAPFDWLSNVYVISAFFLLPFHTWLPPLADVPTNIELYTLLAILAYGMFSRLLVRSLKILLRSR